MLTNTRVFALPPWLARLINGANARELGEMILHAAGAVREAESWKFGNDTLGDDEVASWSTDLCRIARIEKKASFHLQEFRVLGDFGRWEASVEFLNEKKRYCRRYESGAWNSEEEARVALLLTWHQAEQGQIVPTLKEQS